MAYRISIDINDIVQTLIDIVSFENFEYCPSLLERGVPSMSTHNW